MLPLVQGVQGGPESVHFSPVAEPFGVAHFGGSACRDQVKGMSESAYQETLFVNIENLRFHDNELAETICNEWLKVESYLRQAVQKLVTQIEPDLVKGEGDKDREFNVSWEGMKALQKLRDLRSAKARCRPPSLLEQLLHTLTAVACMETRVLLCSGRPETGMPRWPDVCHQHHYAYTHSQGCSPVHLQGRVAPQAQGHAQGQGSYSYMLCITKTPPRVSPHVSLTLVSLGLVHPITAVATKE